MSSGLAQARCFPLLLATALWLFVGAAVSCIGAAFCDNHWYAWEGSPEVPAPPAPAFVRAIMGPVPEEWRECHDRGPSREISYCSLVAPGVHRLVRVREAGWPLRAFRGWHTMDMLDGKLYCGNYAVTHWAVFWEGSQAWRDARLPQWLLLQPVYPGFLVNTVASAAAAFIGFRCVRFVVLLIHRSKRRDAGLCANCGYRLDELRICPECGTPSMCTPATLPP